MFGQRVELVNYGIIYFFVGIIFRDFLEIFLI